MLKIATINGFSGFHEYQNAIIIFLVVSETARPRTSFGPGCKSLIFWYEWIRSLTYSNLKIYLPIIIFSFYLWSIDYRQSFFVRIKHFVRISFWISFNIDSKFCLTLGRVHGQCNWPPEINPYCMFLADYCGTCSVDTVYPIDSIEDIPTRPHRKDFMSEYATYSKVRPSKFRGNWYQSVNRP